MIKFIIPCNEATHVCNKNQYKEASLLEKIKLIIHLIYCRACRKYTKNNMKLSKILKKNTKTVAFSNKAKEELQSTFEKELAKHKN